MRGVLIAAPASRSGKTVITLGLLRALSTRGHAIRSAKSGPDYIDPGFHARATRSPSVTLDAWSMSPSRLRRLASVPEDMLVVEGAMGLFDGAPPDGKGAAADVATALGIPVVLVIDAARQSQSIAALAQGFVRYRSDVTVAGVILNRVGSSRHHRMLKTALDAVGIEVLGALPRLDGLVIPERHLGLFQAVEMPDLDRLLDAAGQAIADGVDLDRLVQIATPCHPASEPAPGLPPLGQRIAIARDEAFGFIYQHMLDDWREAGAELYFASPLADEPLPKNIDAVFLPGGYPELYAGRLAGATRFQDSLRQLAGTATIYGECGGYMMLGDGLIDADGTRHAMAGLLRLETSFAARALHLGYRRLQQHGSLPLPVTLRGHEFHYATTLRSDGKPLFRAWDAEGTEMDAMGLQEGTVMGSFAHVVDAERD